MALKIQASINPSITPLRLHIVEEVESLYFAKAILTHAKCSSNEAEEIAAVPNIFNGHD
ncbi:unnamed protein product [Brugia pahangi]|uniref:GST N-terminal domain-containing protein n=1 Tax=Brugia pahangi TaxID=6280 RepID=A0A0N4TW69_BRUPA|nr:unnamed protein product [Brugia pahangi]